MQKFHTQFHSILSAALILCIMAFLFTGCAKEEKADASGNFYSFVDSEGNEVVLKAEPEKVAVLFSSYADIYVLAGGEVAITVGEAVSRGFVPEGAALVNETAGMKIDTEILMAEEPDLVIASADVSAQVEAAELLREAGIPVALFREESMEDYLNMLDIFTDITGNKEVYAEKGLEVMGEIEHLLQSLEGKERSIDSYLFVRAGSGYSSTSARTAEDHFACDILDKLGCINIADTEKELVGELSLESILVSEPDAIFFTLKGKESEALAYIEELLSMEGWSSLKAVQEGRVYILDKELFNYKPNARWAESYEVMSNYVYGVSE